MELRGCVIGGGPAGLFVSKYLSDKGFLIDLYEKNNHLLGNYNFAKEKVDILKDINSDKIKIFLNSDEKKIKKEKYNFFVVATGGSPRKLEVKGKELLVDALDVIKEIYGQNDVQLHKLKNTNECKASTNILFANIIKKNSILNVFDKFKAFKSWSSNIFKGNHNFQEKDVCVIGSGNVCMDLINYIKGHTKSITVLSRSSLIDAPFDNYLLREILKDSNATIDGVQNENFNSSSRKELKRLDLIRSVSKKGKSNQFECSNCEEHPIKTKTNLHLVFNSNVKEIRKLNDKKEVFYTVGDKFKKNIFDEVIGSIGFIPRKVKLETNAPVYYTGWAKSAKGNIGDAKIDAKETADQISRDFKEV